MCKNRSGTSRTPGQQALLQAVRLTDNKEMGTVIGEASIDDLEWFLQMVNLQLEETPNWVKDESQLHKIQAWYRQVRTLAVGALHNKRVKDRPRVWLLRAGDKLFFIVVGAAIGWALSKFYA